jgi:hypothetical protein
MARSTNDPTHTDRIIAQGKALGRAVEAVNTSEPELTYRSRRV